MKSSYSSAVVLTVVVLCGCPASNRNAPESTSGVTMAQADVDVDPTTGLTVEQLPGSGQATFPAARIVEPVDLDPRDFVRFVEVVLHPLGRALVWPEVLERMCVVAGRVGLALVVQRFGIAARRRGLGL